MDEVAAEPWEVDKVGLQDLEQILEEDLYLNSSTIQVNRVASAVECSMINRLQVLKDTHLPPTNIKAKASTNPPAETISKVDWATEVAAAKAFLKATKAIASMESL